MTPQPSALRYEGVHCTLVIEHRLGVAVLRIAGTDVGEFGDAPMQTLTSTLADSAPFDFFIDARDVRGASIEVSGEWAAWLTAHRQSLKSVTMLTGSRFVQITAEFVRRFAGLEGIMRICTDPAVFDDALAAALERAT